jgi:hypothetical protein
MIKPKLLRIPTKCQTREMLIGTIQQLENVENIVVLIEDAEGVWLLVEDGTSYERINWMLDRAKILLHD